MKRQPNSNQNMKNFNPIESVYKKKLKTVQLKLRQDCIVDPSDNGVIKINTWDQLHEILTSLYDRLDDGQEHMLMLVLNPGLDIIGFKVISSGFQHFNAVDMKIIFRNALFLGATEIILTHNHTSGLLIPSKEDIKFTQNAIKAGSILSIPVADHFIYTHRGLVSMRIEDYCSFDAPAEAISP